MGNDVAPDQTRSRRGNKPDPHHRRRQCLGSDGTGTEPLKAPWQFDASVGTATLICRLPLGATGVSPVLSLAYFTLARRQWHPVDVN